MHVFMQILGKKKNKRDNQTPNQTETLKKNWKQM